MEDPESFGAAGPATPSSVATAVTSPHHRRDQQAFVWSRVHINPSVSASSSGNGEVLVGTVVPPPRSGAASVVVQDKVRPFRVIF
jgi:hypothetical protein